MEIVERAMDITKPPHNILHNILAFMPVLIGMIIVKKRVYSNREDIDILGDNLPLTLIDSLSRIKNRTLSCRSAKPG
jgi:hypothetical protein